MAADVRQVPNVSLKLVPVALVGKTDDCIQPLLAHQLTNLTPAPRTLRLTEFGQAKATFSAIDHSASGSLFANVALS
jgi:hypothetical protein